MASRPSPARPKPRPAPGTRYHGSRDLNWSRYVALYLAQAGWIILGVGILSQFQPGTGMLMTLVGLAILSSQYGWARRLMEPVRVKAWRGAAEGVETVPRIALSALVALVMIGVAVLGLWSPPAPGWWPVA